MQSHRGLHTTYVRGVSVVAKKYVCCGWQSICCVRRERGRVVVLCDVGVVYVVCEVCGESLVLHSMS